MQVAMKNKMVRSIGRTIGDLELPKTRYFILRACPIVLWDNLLTPPSRLPGPGLGGSCGILDPDRPFRHPYHCYRRLGAGDPFLPRL